MVEKIMHELTLRDRESKREFWLSKGFDRINKKEGALLRYWEKRIRQDPKVLTLSRRVYAEYLNNLKLSQNNKPTKLQAVKTIPKPTVTHTPIGVSDMVKNFSRSMANWAKKGFKVVTPEQFEERLKTCQSCDQWNSAALAGTGRCKVCGCSTQAKLRLATEKCPIDKWGRLINP